MNYKLFALSILVFQSLTLGCSNKRSSSTLLSSTGDDIDALAKVYLDIFNASSDDAARIIEEVRTDTRAGQYMMAAAKMSFFNLHSQKIDEQVEEVCNQVAQTNSVFVIEACGQSFTLAGMPMPTEVAARASTSLTEWNAYRVNDGNLNSDQMTIDEKWIFDSDLSVPHQEKDMAYIKIMLDPFSFISDTAGLGIREHLQHFLEGQLYKPQFSEAYNLVLLSGVLFPKDPTKMKAIPHRHWVNFAEAVEKDYWGRSNDSDKITELLASIQTIDGYLLKEGYPRLFEVSTNRELIDYLMIPEDVQSQLKQISSHTEFSAVGSKLDPWRLNTAFSQEIVLEDGHSWIGLLAEYGQGTPGLPIFLAGSLPSKPETIAANIPDAETLLLETGDALRQFSASFYQNNAKSFGCESGEFSYFHDCGPLTYLYSKIVIPKFHRFVNHADEPCQSKGICGRTAILDLFNDQSMTQSFYDFTKSEHGQTTFDELTKLLANDSGVTTGNTLGFYPEKALVGPLYKVNDEEHYPVGNQYLMVLQRKGKIDLRGLESEEHASNVLRRIYFYSRAVAATLVPNMRNDYYYLSNLFYQSIYDNDLQPSELVSAYKNLEMGNYFLFAWYKTDDSLTNVY